jgi:hypothetical protein
VNKQLGYVSPGALCCRGNLTLRGRYGGASIRGTSFCGLSLVVLVSLSHTQQNTNSPTASPACMNATGCQQWPWAYSLRTVTGDLHRKATAALKLEVAASATLLGIQHKILSFYHINVQTRYHLPIDIRGGGEHRGLLAHLGAQFRHINLCMNAIGFSDFLCADFILYISSFCTLLFVFSH